MSKMLYNTASRKIRSSQIKLSIFVILFFISLLIYYSSLHRSEPEFSKITIKHKGFDKSQVYDENDVVQEEFALSFPTNTIDNSNAPKVKQIENTEKVFGSQNNKQINTPSKTTTTTTTITTIDNNLVEFVGKFNVGHSPYYPFHVKKVDVDFEAKLEKYSSENPTFRGSRKEARLLCDNYRPYTLFSQAIESMSPIVEKEALCSFSCDSQLSPTTECSGTLADTNNKYYSAPIEFILDAIAKKEAQRGSALPFCSVSMNMKLLDGEWIVPCHPSVCSPKGDNNKCDWSRARWVPKNCKINYELMDESHVLPLGSKLAFTRKYKSSTKLSTVPKFLIADYIPRVHDVSAVTHMSTNKLEVLLQLAKYWEGPLSVSVYIQKTIDDEQEEIDKLKTFWENNPIVREYTTVHLVLARDYEGRSDFQMYPFNFMRNVAMEGGLTNFAYTLDVDFMPSKNTYKKLKGYINNKVNYNKLVKEKVVLTAPAFETDYYKLSDVPREKKSLKVAFEENKVIQFHQHYKRAHLPTNYRKWFKENSVYDIKYRRMYEPYVLIYIPTAPRFDEKFKMRFWDKQSYFLTLAYAGFQFKVLPDVFLVHINHSYGKSPAKFLFYSNSCATSDLDKRLRAFYESNFTIAKEGYLYN